MDDTDCILEETIRILSVIDREKEPARESVRNSETANSEMSVPSCCDMGYQQD
jgi:hypothetical protein